MQEAAAKPSAAAQGALATYKDLCALAVALERPRLLYALIDVAAEATPHAARRGSLLGVRSSSVQASRALLEGHAAALLPKLYRGSCAPNPRQWPSARYPDRSIREFFGLFAGMGATVSSFTCILLRLQAGGSECYATQGIFCFFAKVQYVRHVVVLGRCVRACMCKIWSSGAKGVGMHADTTPTRAWQRP